MSWKCKFGFHWDGAVQAIYHRIITVWNCECVDHEEDYYYMKVACLRCGRITWKEISGNSYHGLLKIGTRIAKWEEWNNEI
jgi:hypothetical protein